MKNKNIYTIITIVTFLLFANSCSKNAQKQLNYDFTWTYTYVKSKENHRKDLKEIILKNWFSMDSIAKKQGLINDYELIENISESDSTQWDFIVAVEYFTKENYAEIAEDFEKIRKSHNSIKINGLQFNDIGKVVKSEVVKKTE